MEDYILIFLDISGSLFRPSELNGFLLTNMPIISRQSTCGLAKMVVIKYKMRAEIEARVTILRNSRFSSAAITIN